MTVEELKELRTRMQIDIAGMIWRFEEKTGAEVTDLSLTHQEEIGGKRKVIAVTATVKV